MLIRLRRNNDVDLEFEGELLAEQSSHQEGMSRWSEIRIYKSTTGKYVVETCGRTTLPGEVDLVKVVVVDHPDEVRIALRRKSHIEYLTHLALDTLEIAAEKDPGLAAALIERI